MADIASTQEHYDAAKTEIQNLAPDLTDFNEGSVLDILTGVMATAVSEAQRTVVQKFTKTFVNTANGPEVTGGDDDLQYLLVDHFGTAFARPLATEAEGIVTFSRPTAAAGPVLIPAGTIVKTAPNASGVALRYATDLAVTLTGLTVNAAVEAVLTGSAGNALAGKVTIVESTLTDTSITVNNSAAFSGGTNVATDAEYRAFALNQLISLRGATAAAIKAKALTVPGVVQAVPTEKVQTVIGYNTSNNTTTGNSFKISRNYLYIADANGSANSTLIAAVEAAIAFTRAAGVNVTVVGASAVIQNITYSVVLNGAGPNFASLQTSLQPITDDIRQYIQALPIGTGLVRANLTASILAKWGGSGSGDVTSMSISTPTGDVAIGTTQTLVPGTIASA